MSPLDALAIFAAGLAAGTINVIVGSGSLITFPTLLALGYPPVLANVSNNVGLVPGNISATLAYRRELVGQRGPVLAVGVFLTGIYGGYFGAAQGVILIALLAIFIDDGLQRLNGTKNALALVVNAVAGVFFIATTHISWSVAGLIAVGSFIGGQVGGKIGRRLPAPVLRVTIVVVGLGVAIALAVVWH
jgi:uncharacterized membrane protein YfcA